MSEKDPYRHAVERFEPDIAMTDAGAYGTSIAISLKRIADALENRPALAAPRLVCSHGMMAMFHDGQGYVAGGCTVVTFPGCPTCSPQRKD